MTNTIILWDIDGTILLTGGAGRSSFNRTFLELFGEDDIWQDTKASGKTDDLIIEEVFEKRFKRLPNSKELSQIRKRYIEIMAEELPLSQNFRLLPYVTQALENLSQKDRLYMGLITGNYKDTAHLKLKQAKLDHHFQFGGFACDSKTRLGLSLKAKERALQYVKNEAERIITIGDTTNDIYCGNAIGAITIGVCTGSYSYDVLKESGADFVINDLSELENIIDP